MIDLNQDYWPSLDWRSNDPENVGIDSQQLNCLGHEIEARNNNVDAFLVVRDGYLAYEKYYNNTSKENKHLVASVTKSFISALIGIAINKGYIEGVDQRVVDFFPEYDLGQDEYLKRQVTIEHLLTMTAGFYWRSGPRANEQLIDRLRRAKDWVAFILNLPLRENLFGRFQYNSGCSHLLSAIITRSTGRCAQDFAEQYLFKPIGIEEPDAFFQHSYTQQDVFRNTSGIWPRDPQGNSIGGWGLFLTAMDMARFGYLYLKRGCWSGEQTIPEQWVKDSISPHTPGYGYHFWLREMDELFIFSAVGQGGNHIFCVPDMDLVVVFACKPNARWGDRWLLLEKYLIPAIRN